MRQLLSIDTSSAQNGGGGEPSAEERRRFSCLVHQYARLWPKPVEQALVAAALVDVFEGLLAGGRVALRLEEVAGRFLELAGDASILPQAATLEALTALLPESVAVEPGRLRLHLPPFGPPEAARVENDPAALVLGAMKNAGVVAAELTATRVAMEHLNQELDETNRGVVALYAELDQKAELLQRSSELKTRFLSNMSHELRTPLNSIISLARMLIERVDGELSAEQDRQARYIARSAEELLELVNDLLDIAKVEAGKLVVHPKWFEVGDLFGALRGVMRPLLSEDVVLAFDEPKGVPALHTDEGKVAQILRNLISNALKFTEKGEVRVSAAFEEGSVIFRVADTGIGIAPEHTENIFAEFVQVHGDHQTRIKGTGLGLPLSKRLAELLGGTLHVESRLGEGSVFSVCLPLRYQALEEDDEPVSNGELKKTILIVDDDEVSRYVLRSTVSEQLDDYEIMEAEGGRQALELARARRPAVLFLDLYMPEMDGFSCLRALKRDPSTNAIPVVVNTSHALSAEQRAFLDPLTVAILSKKTSSREQALRSVADALRAAGVPSRENEG